MRLKKEQVLFVRSMGKALRVTAICTDEAELAEYRKKHRDEVVVAQFGPYSFVAGAYDPGVEITKS